jgi:adenosylcobinamide-GDP ribazoletransferase
MSLWRQARLEGTYVLVAAQFLTRLPVPALPGFEHAWLERSSAYFPLVGALVGAISGAVYVTAHVVWGPPVAAVLAIAAGIAATGAFHEDGLADTADGLGGGQTPEQRLLIMKDSRIGTYGTAALLIALGLKVAALASLGPWAGALSLLAAHAGGRVVPVVASAILPYAGEAGVAKVAPVSPSRARVALAIVIGAAPFALLPPGLAIGAIIAGALASAWLLAKAMRSIGGQTGDVLGAAEQVFEVCVLLVLAGTWW